MGPIAHDAKARTFSQYMNFDTLISKVPDE